MNKLTLYLSPASIERAKALCEIKGITIDQLFVYLLTKAEKRQEGEEASTTNTKE
jgi:hypothetical protein